jgi:hypothetical protein
MLVLDVDMCQVTIIVLETDMQVAPMNTVDKQASVPTESSSESETKDQKVPADSNNAYYSYLPSLQDPTDLKEEHAQFVAAKAELQCQQHSAVNLVS